ncbi:MAG: tail-specific protease [Puniceicoccaceae bacterium]|nr:MAG: tail-specific protease [Puniceicoccaceae bacterium]
MQFFRFPSLTAALALLFSGLLAVASPVPAADLPSFETTRVMKDETRVLIQLLESYHYAANNGRTPISDDIFRELPGLFAADLDVHRLYFLQSDLDRFDRRFRLTLGTELRQEGSLEAAFEIFTVYRQRVLDRVEWILARLEDDFAFDQDDAYPLDRKEAAWPADPEEANRLWEKRLKYEMIVDLLNDKPVETAAATVRRRYDRLARNVSEVDSTEVQEMFLSALTRRFDPHSSFFSARTLEEFNISMRLSLVGIGALLAEEDGYCVIREVIPGGPADLSGQLQPNDRIVAVAQEGEEPVDVVGMNLRRVVNKIRGKKGSEVILTIIPADAADAAVRRQLTLIRDVIELNASRAKAELHQVPGPADRTFSIGVIDIPSFYGPVDSAGSQASASVTDDVRELIGKLKDLGAEGIVLDFRRNGGGLLPEAVDLTGLFIESGPVVQVRDSQNSTYVREDRNRDIAWDGPLAVLTSRFSASASEIVAGALQNYGRAIVVGSSSTHGKGTVQAVLEMQNFIPRRMVDDRNTGAAKLTVQKFYLPDGASTQKLGVIPDVVLPAVEDVLSIGEASLPHAITWDTIPALRLRGRPLDETFVNGLNASAAERRLHLPEFALLEERIGWFREREEQERISLNLEARRSQKERDEKFRQRLREWQAELAEANFSRREVLLDSASRNDKADTESETPSAELPDSDAPDLNAGDDEAPPFDIHLREALRILADAILFSPTPGDWIESNPVLAARWEASLSGKSGSLE